MNDRIEIETSKEVFSVILARHPEITAFGRYSHPQGSPHNPSKGAMFTIYGFSEHYIPILSALTEWDIDLDRPNDRLNVRQRYCLLFRKCELDQ